MILPGDIIKHPKFLDVCFYVYKIESNSDRIKVSGKWMNMGFVESWPMGIRQILELTVDEIRNWQICKDPSSPCLRYAAWT